MLVHARRRMATAQATTDHDEIRQWVEARGGHPTRVKRTGSRKDPGVLRIDFPGFSGEDTLEEIEWDEFFEWFDRNGLALLLSDEEGNRFNKLVSRETARAASSRKRAGSSRKASSSKKASASTKRASASTKKASTKKASTKKAASSTKKASSSTKKASTSKKATPSKKATTSKKTTKKASTSTKKASTSTKKATTSKKTTKKASASARKAPAKKAASTKRASTRGGSSTTTTNHDEIRQWVEARGGFPAHVKRTGTRRGDLGVLRIDYPGYSGRDTLERIDWEDWFDAFERNKLAFLYQDKRNSRFSKLVNR